MLEKLSPAQLVLLHNAVAERPVKRFENACKALARTHKAIEASGLSARQAMVTAGLLPAEAPQKPKSSLLDVIEAALTETSPSTQAEPPAAAEAELATPVVTAALLVNKIGLTRELAEAVEAFIARKQAKQPVREKRAPGTPKQPSGKSALIVELCSRPQGATMKDLLVATGWPSLAAKTVCGKLAERAGLQFSFIARSKDRGPTVYRMSA